MRRGSETRKDTRYKVRDRSVGAAFQEVGGGHSTVDRRDNITLREGRSPALAGAYSDEEGPVTAKGMNPLAQCTRRKVQVLQNKLHRAAKRDLGRRFGILYDKVCCWEVLWTAWIRVQRNKGAPGVDGRTVLILSGQSDLKRIMEFSVMEPLNQRIAIRYHMPPLNPEETKLYVAYHLKLAGAKEPLFNEQTLEAVHQVSFGIPRKIGTVVEQALTYAMFDQKHTVTPEIVLKVKNLQG